MCRNKPQRKYAAICNSYFLIFIILLFTLMVIGIFGYIICKTTELQQKLERGHNIADRYCYSCHFFNDEPANGMQHVRTSDHKIFTDDYPKTRIKYNPSGIAPENSDDIKALVEYIRSTEKPAKKLIQLHQQNK